jgi:hypothetical protein
MQHVFHIIFSRAAFSRALMLPLQRRARLQNAHKIVRPFVESLTRFVQRFDRTLIEYLTTFHSASQRPRTSCDEPL